MENRTLPHSLSLAFLACLVVAASGGAFRFLWVFPSDPGGLPLWMILVATDLFLARAFPALQQPRLLLWCAGLLYFAARSGVPLVAVALILGAGSLWVAEKSRMRYVPVATAAGALLFLLARPAGPGEFRFSGHLLASFALFRMFSWLEAVRKRGVRPGFLATMEYFLAPAFWLSPLHAAPQLFQNLARPPEPHVTAERSVVWIARGFLHAALFSLVAAYGLAPLSALYRAGVSAFRWWHWAGAAPLLVLASYLEISRVSYVAAGVLSLAGHHVEPDFRGFLRSRDLVDFAGRFHHWLWDYAAGLLRPRLSLFSAFLSAAFVVLWLFCPASIPVVLCLALLTGALAVVTRMVSGTRAGILFTWAAIFVVYFLAYPAFGLGWGLRDFAEFFRG